MVPTYNEAQNVGRLLQSLLKSLRAATRTFAVLVVDDGSPDGTGELVDAAAAVHPEVRVLHRHAKAGLGAAYLAGFEEALRGGATRVVQMDADLSHDPRAVPALLRAAEGAELVLGSRYVAGGATPDWPLSRRLISRSGCMYARRMLGLGLHDLTGGFKCWDARLLRRVVAEGIESQGYVFQVEMTFRALQLGAAVREVPIVFHDRRAGASKMSSDVVLEAVLEVPRLRRARRPAVQPAAVAPTALTASSAAS